MNIYVPLDILDTFTAQVQCDNGYDCAQWNQITQIRWIRPNES